MRSQQYDHEFIQLNLYSEYQCPMCRRVGNSFMPLCDDPESLSLLSTSSSGFDKTEQHSPQFQLWLADVSKLIKKKSRFTVWHTRHTHNKHDVVLIVFTHTHTKTCTRHRFYFSVWSFGSRALSLLSVCVVSLSLLSVLSFSLRLTHVHHTV